jgi:hypothetical protein
MENGSTLTDDDFSRFWACYPKKKNKGDARKAWKQTEGIRPPIEQVIAAVERGKCSVDWHKADREGTVGAFVPYPGTWLRGECWHDEYKVVLSSIKSAIAQEQYDAAREAAKQMMAKPTPEQVEAARKAIAQAGLRLVG